MKKHYILAFVASVVCGMSAQAQESVQSVPRNHIQIQAASLAASPLVQEPSSFLRSGTTNQLDSVIRTDGNGAKTYKYLYEYTNEGRVAGITAYAWDAATSNWASEKSYS